MSPSIKPLAIVGARISIDAARLVIPLRATWTIS
jgi:hypothetical protein